MNLWIRSQNKSRLMKVDNLQIIYNEDDKEFPYYINAPYELLGAYKTKERAVEILDEIQNAICGIIALEDIQAESKKLYTGTALFSKITGQLFYEMPQE